MLAALLAAAAMVGLPAGWLLTIVIARVPAGLPVLPPPARCLSCGVRVPVRNRLPVAGWALRRGRCAACHGPIGLQDPVVEVAAAVLFVLATLLTWNRGLLPLTPALLYLVSIGIALTAIDVMVHRLPNAIVLPSYPVLAVLLAVASLISGDWWALARSGMGAAALFCCYLLIAVAFPSGMGWGDVKLAGLLGGVLGYVGWAALVLGAFAAFAFGALFAIVAIAAGRASRRTALPFGPFMILGAGVGIVLGGVLGEMYLGAAVG